MLPGCIEALPVEYLDTRLHRLALSVVSESERHPHSIGNGKFKLGQYPAGELAGPTVPPPKNLLARRPGSPVPRQGAEVADDTASAQTPTLTLKNHGSRACALRTVGTRCACCPVRWRGVSAAHRASRLASVQAGIDNATNGLGRRLHWASADVIGWIGRFDELMGCWVCLPRFPVLPLLLGWTRILVIHCGAMALLNYARQYYDGVETIFASKPGLTLQNAHLFSSHDNQQRAALGGKLRLQATGRPSNFRSTSQ
jgi:hypothetical protein